MANDVPQLMFILFRRVQQMGMSILDFASTQRWRERLVLEKPHMAVQNHLWALQVFCEWAKKNPDELMLERQRERTLKSDDAETVSFKRIVEYQLEDRSKTKRSKALIVKALASFYGNNHASIYDQSITRVR